MKPVSEETWAGLKSRTGFSKTACGNNHKEKIWQIINENGNVEGDNSQQEMPHSQSFTMSFNKNVLLQNWFLDCPQR